MAGEEKPATAEASAAAAATPPETAKRQVLQLVPALPFDDDPSSYVRAMQELADAHARDDEA
jgi:hypothetical protein